MHENKDTTPSTHSEQKIEQSPTSNSEQEKKKTHLPTHTCTSQSVCLALVSALNQMVADEDEQHSLLESLRSRMQGWLAAHQRWSSWIQQVTEDRHCVWYS